MEIGSRLREAREAKNLSLEEVQGMTKIQTRYLQAIENGNFDVIPGSFYVRAFIKEYAGAVGLDPEQLLAEHENELPAPTEDTSIQYTRVKRNQNESGTSLKTPAFFSFLPALIVAILIIGLGFAIWYYIQASPGGSDNSAPVGNGSDESAEEVVVNPDEEKESENQNDEGSSSSDNGNSDKEKTESEQKEDPALKLEETGTQGDEETAVYTLTNPSEEVILKVGTDSKHWLEVINSDGEHVYNDMFYADNAPLKEDMTGQDSFGIRIGNSSAANITVDGVVLDFPEGANLSKIQRITINIENNKEPQ